MLRLLIASIGGGSVERRAAAACVLALALVALARAGAPTDSVHASCASLTKDAQELEIKVPKRTVHLVLVCYRKVACAAAALLRAALLSAGHEPHWVKLVRHYAADDLCSLLTANRTLFSYVPDATEGKGQATPVVVGVAVPWRLRADSSCGFGAQALRVMAPGAAPLAPRLHARFHDEVNVTYCKSRVALALVLAGDREALLNCGFIRSKSEGNATVYVVEEEASGAGSDAGRTRVSRDYLAELVKKPDNGSFMFVDADVWNDTGAVPADPPPTEHSLLVADEYELISHTISLFLLLNKGRPPNDNDVGFAPKSSDLRAVLDSAVQLGEEEAACKHLYKAVDFEFWRSVLQRSRRRRAVAVLCNDDKAFKELTRNYTTVTTIVASHVNNVARLSALGVILYIDIEFVNCRDPTALVDKINGWRLNGILRNIVGVVAPAEVAEKAAPLATKVYRPLLAYTPGTRGVCSATGRVEHLARALRRLLAACHWRRVGVVAEQSPFAERVAGALAVAGPQVRVASAHEAREAVVELHELDARVLVVLGSATTVKHALVEAYRRNLTAARGYAWIVSEYATVFESNETLPPEVAGSLLPLSVSFQYRGSHASPAGASELRTYLEDQWHNIPWSRHLTALVDSLITVGVGFARLIERYNDSLDYPDTDDALSHFWDGVRNPEIPGLIENLKYDEEGVEFPSVYVERWASAEKPPMWRVTWRGHDAGVGIDLCPMQDPPDDGDVRCLMRAGDPFRPQCYDAACAGGVVALAVSLLGVAGACIAVRRWMTRRDRRLERAATVRVLAQREAAFAELEPHLVERSALRLGEELGAGRFGRVWLGEVRSTRRRSAYVAVKALREGASPAEEGQFLREARTLAALRHERVVRFEGVCWEGGPPLLLMEHAFFGDLLRYLRARRHLAEDETTWMASSAPALSEEAVHVAPEALTKLAREAADALAYLSERGLVHRDVRAANCLVDAHRSLKLADFGLAREINAPDGEYACRGRALFPVLWMAPESLARGVATAASDVWSFGVLALELVTLGARPFGAATPASAVRQVLGGGRPPLPRDACAETRALALACWRRAPGLRPPAARLEEWLARRPCALRPALAADLQEPDCDSGIGVAEPDYHADLLTA